MHGTTGLFSRFIAAAPADVSIRSIPLPPEPLTYDELAERLSTALPEGKPVIIAESFSGPLAVKLAMRHPVAALVFCNSFVAAPRSRLLRWLLPQLVFKLPVPGFLLRRYMLGRTADEMLLKELTQAIASVPAFVLASRLNCALRADEVESFSRCEVPVLYLRGTDDRLVPDTAWRRLAERRSITRSYVAGPHLLLQVNPAGA